MFQTSNKNSLRSVAVKLLKDKYGFSISNLILSRLEHLCKRPGRKLVSLNYLQFNINDYNNNAYDRRLIVLLLSVRSRIPITDKWHDLITIFKSLI